MATIYDSTWSAAARADDLAQHCQQPQRVRDGTWYACCPAHEDRSPSLSITATDTRVLVYCHAGCATEAVLAALGLTMADLFVESPQASPPPPDRPARPSGPPRVVATYDYHDAQGQVVYQVWRWEPGRRGRRKDFSQHRPNGHGGWLANMDGVTRVLFRLPHVLHAVRDGVPIYLCEGEKNALDVTALGLVATTHPGGAGKWAPHYTVTLRSAHVVLLEDNDEPGQRHTALVAPQLYGVAASLRVLRLPDLPPKGDVSDWLAAGGTREQLAAWAAATPRWEPPPPPAPAVADVTTTAGDERPRIRLSADLRGMVEALQDVLEAENPPQLYVHADRLCVLRRHHGRAASSSLPTVGGLYIADLTRAHLTELASTIARWETYDGRVKAWRHTLPSDKALDAFLARGQWPFPALHGIVTAPTLRPDGSVLDQPGYDTMTGLYYDPQGVQFPPTPAAPDLGQAQWAIKALREVFCDFLYADPAYFSTVLAAVLSLVGRHAISGNVPLFGISATTPGSGKGLLVDVIALLATGRPAPKWTQTRDEEEERKQLLALALEGDALVCIDNCTYPLGSPGLDLVLTAGMVKGRVLGKTATTTVHLHAVFFATGNNLQYQGDLARRVLPIVLDPQMERPEERSGFRHPQLLTWVAQERPRLLSAALTLLQAYWHAGCPSQALTPYGSFEAWSDTVRSALVWAGEPDPAQGRADLQALADPQYEALGQLLAAWEACYQQRPETLHKAVQDATMMTHDKTAPTGPWHDLREALGSLDPHYDGHRLNLRTLGQYMKALTGRIVAGKKFVRAGVYSHRTLWKIETIR